MPTYKNKSKTIPDNLVIWYDNEIIISNINKVEKNKTYEVIDFDINESYKGKAIIEENEVIKFESIAPTNYNQMGIIPLTAEQTTALREVVAAFDLKGNIDESNKLFLAHIEDYLLGLLSEITNEDKNIMRDHMESIRTATTNGTLKSNDPIVYANYSIEFMIYIDENPAIDD